jgi:hypothetical protein
MLTAATIKEIHLMLEPLCLDTEGPNLQSRAPYARKTPRFQSRGLNYYRPEAQDSESKEQAPNERCGQELRPHHIDAGTTKEN